MSTLTYKMITSLDDPEKVMPIIMEAVDNYPSKHKDEGAIIQIVDSYFQDDHHNRAMLVACDEENQSVVGIILCNKLEGHPIWGTAAMEILWYVVEDFRRSTVGARLFKAYETWAQQVGCKAILATALSNSGGQLTKLYKKRGYKLIERSFVKELD